MADSFKTEHWPLEVRYVSKDKRLLSNPCSTVIKSRSAEKGLEIKS